MHPIHADLKTKIPTRPMFRPASGMLRSLALLLAVSLISCRASTSPSSSPAGIADQYDFNEMACGPTCLYNQMALNPALNEKLATLPGSKPSDRVDALIRHFFLKPSPYPDKLRFDAKGISPSELLLGANEWRAELSLPALSVLSSLRHENETSRHFSRRMHTQLSQSMERGVPPIIAISCYSPTKNEAQARAGGDPYSWTRLDGHFLLVTEIGPIENDTGWSFDIKVLDPAGGKIRRVHLHVEEFRGFCAQNEKDGWKEGRPALVATAPFLNLKSSSQPWHLRTNFLLDGGIGFIDPEQSHWTESKGATNKSESPGKN